MTTLNAYMLLEPNWKSQFKIAYRFDTSILRTMYGHEQRSALLSWPRRTVRYDVQFNSGADTAYYTGFLANYIHQTIGVPLWAQESQLTAQAASGQPVLNLGDVDKLEFQVGAWVFIYGGSRDAYEVGKVQGLTATSITLTGNLTGTWPTGTLVYPMLPMLMEQQVPYKKDTSRVGGASLLFKETWNGDAVHTLGSHTFPGYNGYTVFNQEANWAMPPNWKAGRPSERHGGFGLNLTYTRDPESEFTLDASYMGIGVEHIAKLRGLYNTHMGKWKQFWLPTWQKDVKVTGAIGASDTSITVGDYGYIDSWAGKNIIGKHLYFLFPDGTETYRKVIGWPNNTQLDLDGQVGTAVPAEHLRALTTCFLLPARFDVDEMELQYHRTGLATTRLRMASLHDEVMTTSTTTTTTTTTS